MEYNNPCTFSSLHPFPFLNVFNKLIHVDMPKGQLIAKLKNILEGVQHIPSLLLSCPTSELKQFNLQKYLILPREPLHDLKGCLNYLLPKTNVHDLIQRCVY